MDSEKTGQSAAESSIEIAFTLILHAGNSRSASIQAARAAAQGNLSQAEELMAQADEEMSRAHDLQTKMLQDEMNGVEHELSLAMVHAQDHLSMATVQRECSLQLIEVYRELAEQKRLIASLLDTSPVAR